MLLQVNVKDHKLFKLEGQNVVSEINLSLSEAILGCKMTVQTIDGKINIELKPGTNDNDEVILKNMGAYPF